MLGTRTETNTTSLTGQRLGNPLDSVSIPSMSVLSGTPLTVLQQEMIKVRGWQVSPAELQAVLMLHPDIWDAAVIGILHPKDDTTETPRAYVVKKPGSDVDLADIKNHMSNYLARYKSLDGGVVFVDSIPKNPAGKILRKVLKDRANAELQSARSTSKLAQSWRMFIKATELLYEHWRSMSIPISSLATTTDSDNNETGSSIRAPPTTASSVYSDVEGEMTDWSGKAPHDEGNGILLNPRDFDRSRILDPVDTWLLGIKIPGSYEYEGKLSGAGDVLHGDVRRFSMISSS